MKYDINGNVSRGAKRTLNAFTDAMIDLLCVKSFENVTVGELCEAADYPRATFYNYFDDKYDMLTCCWEKIARELELKDAAKVKWSSGVLMEYFGRLYDFIMNNRDKFLNILKNNGETGYVFNDFFSFLRRKVRDIFKENGEIFSLPIPRDLTADHFSNTVVLLAKYCCLSENPCSKNEAGKYLVYLLGGIEMFK